MAVVYTNASVQDFLERYEVGETIGVGGFAVVKRGRDRHSGEPVAIKVVDKSRYAQGDTSLEREIQVLCKVDHPNCIKLYSVYVTQRKVYLVTELVTGGELLDRITERGHYPEREAASVVRQILRGVAYLHAHGIVHRDLKLENMVLADATTLAPLKIADFGLSKFFSSDNVLSTMCGSPQYVAPEVLGVGDAPDGGGEYSPAVDMWSVGVILFIILSGYSPFDDDNDAVLFDKIRRGAYDADDPVWETMSSGAKDLVARLLTVDASARLTAEQALAHPWIVEAAPPEGEEERAAAAAGGPARAPATVLPAPPPPTGAAGAAPAAGAAAVPPAAPETPALGPDAAAAAAVAAVAAAPAAAAAAAATTTAAAAAAEPAAGAATTAAATPTTARAAREAALRAQNSFRHQVAVAAGAPAAGAAAGGGDGAAVTAAATTATAAGEHAPPACGNAPAAAAAAAAASPAPPSEDSGDEVAAAVAKAAAMCGASGPAVASTARAPASADVEVVVPAAAAAAGGKAAAAAAPSPPLAA